jgi:enamine deaminase RidA (YjgF/YER057c/UK114 family)
MNRREALFAAMAGTLRPINPGAVAYAGACEVAGASRLLFISGQTPERPDGSVPGDFSAQCRVTWANVERQLRDAGMTLDHLVKVTTFLSDRRFRADNSLVRRDVLKHRTPALTVIIADIYDEAWLLEIEAIAAA